VLEKNSRARKKFSPLRIVTRVKRGELEKIFRNQRAPKKSATKNFADSFSQFGQRAETRMNARFASDGVSCWREPAQKNSRA
jgi:hypothetical protein